MSQIFSGSVRLKALILLATANWDSNPIGYCRNAKISSVYSVVCNPYCWLEWKWHQSLPPACALCPQHACILISKEYIWKKWMIIYFHLKGAYTFLLCLSKWNMIAQNHYNDLRTFTIVRFLKTTKLCLW